MAEKIDHFIRASFLDPANGEKDVKLCKICGAPSPVFDVVDFLKHCAFRRFYQFGLSGIPVPYQKCEYCGFLFTETFDNWSENDFAAAIYNDHYVKVDPDYLSERPSYLAETIASKLALHKNCKILDYGSGSGVFSKEMRERGFKNVENYDPFSNPVKPTDGFDVVTCLEVLEHTPFPMRTLADIAALLNGDGIIIFSQSLQPLNIDEIRCNWWYIAPRNGHISTFTEDTLHIMGQRFGLNLYVGGWIFAFAPQRMSAAAEEIVGSIGPPFRPIRIAAPRVGGGNQWYEPEQRGDATFRWTRATMVRWKITPAPRYPYVLQVHLPILLEVRDGFARGCGFTIAGRPVAAVVRGARLVSEPVMVQRPGEDDIILTMPPLISPFESRHAPDARPLGLAVPIDKDGNKDGA